MYVFAPTREFPKTRPRIRRENDSNTPENAELRFRAQTN